MKKSHRYLYFFLFLLTFVLSSCSDTLDIGLVEVKGQKDVFFHITQDNEIDVVSGVDYEIISKKNKVIAPKTFLFGSYDYLDDISDFEAFSFDSIIYLTYDDPNNVHAMFDLKSGKGYPRSLNDGNMDYKTKFKIAHELFAIIKSNNPNLTADWKN